MNKEARNNVLIISAIVVVILLFRIVFVDLYQVVQAKYGFEFSHQFRSFFENIFALALCTTLDIVAVWQLSKRMPYGQHSLRRFGVDFVVIVVVSSLGVLLTNLSVWEQPMTSIVRWGLLFSLLTIFLINLMIVGVLDLIFFFWNSRTALSNERKKKLQAQYQYLKLKEQLNPHFLFNCLNILDYLVQNEEKERASDYIKKLAGVYRYLLRTNELPTVRLDEELSFVRQYVDLLQVRFPTGLDVRIDIDEQFLPLSVVPCSLQLLVENAIKHNIVNKTQPLHIRIFQENGMVVVTNNIQLKLSIDDSMNIGLNNLQRQYVDVMNRQVEIVMTDDEFIVRLPLL